MQSKHHIVSSACVAAEAQYPEAQDRCKCGQHWPGAGSEPCGSCLQVKGLLWCMLKASDTFTGKDLQDRLPQKFWAYIRAFSSLNKPLYSKCQGWILQGRKRKRPKGGDFREACLIIKWDLLQNEPWKRPGVPSQAKVTVFKTVALDTHCQRKQGGKSESLQHNRSHFFPSHLCLQD